MKTATKQVCPACLKRFEPRRSDSVTCSVRCRVARHRLLHALTPPWPEGGPFDLFMVDLPLRWTGWSPKGEGRSPQQHYPCTDVAALIRLRPMIEAISAKDAAYCFWVYGPRLDDTLRVIKGWGLTFKGELFVWRKISKTDPSKSRIGNGMTTRKEVETTWLATRGKGLPRLDKGVRQIIDAPRLIHSEKPDEAYQRLESLYGGTNRLDMFGRRPRPGWLGWGNEAEG